MSTKSANQLYKESGSDLPFSQWLEQNKPTMFIKNQMLTNIIDQQKTELKPTQEKIPVNSNKIFGLNQNIIIAGGVIVTLAIIYKLYQKNKVS